MNKEQEFEILKMDRDLKIKLTRFSILAVIFFITAMGYHFFSGSVIRTKPSIKDKIQTILQQKEKFISGILDKITLAALQDPTFSSIHKIIPQDLWESNGMVIFTYRDDSLLYWSDNRVPALSAEQVRTNGKSFIRHGNGWFNLVIAQKEDLKLIGLILVKNNYPYQNEYLENDYQEDLDLDLDVVMDTVPGEINISDNDGSFLFSLDLPDKSVKYEAHGLLIFMLLSASLIFFLLTLFYLYHLFDFFRKRPLLLFLAFGIDVLILRSLILWLKFPGFLYQTELFSPYYFATSIISPSLGDLVLNNFIWLILAWIFYRKINLNMINLTSLQKKLFGLLMILISAGFYFLLMLTMKRMILDSSFELSLNNIFNIDIFSSLAFLAIIAQFMAFFLATAKMACTLCSSGLDKLSYLVIALIGAGLLIAMFSGGSPVFLSLIFSGLFLLYLLSFYFFKGKKGGYHNISGILFYIVLFSLTGTFVLDYYQETKEKEKRKILITELSAKRDPMMEFEFGILSESIRKDAVLRGILADKDSVENWEMKFTEYLKQNYFNDFWENYEQLITICSDRQILEIQPEGYLVNCYDYFNGILEGNKADTVTDGLFFFSNRSENNNYIAIFEFVDHVAENKATSRVFVELYYKYLKETGLGYPDLLIDKKVKMISGLANYSYSRYYEGSLVYKYGDFSYRLALKPLFNGDSSSYFVDKEGYNHLVSRIDEDNVLIISKKNPTWLDLAAPFSYLFILFSLFILVFILLIMLPNKFRKLEFNFSNQLQLSIILIIVISFFILGVITRSRIIHLNNEKNRDILSEKTFSVLTELEHKIGDLSVIPVDMQGYLQELLYKFSLIFYSDINIYDPSGNLIASSRPQIFEEGLLSVKMNTAAFHKLAYDMNLLYIQNEKIGLQEYLSAYIPFRNNNDEIIAYINLPYFAKQTEIRKEISDFLVAYINVYVLLIVLAIMVTIVVSRLVTRPLQLIRDKLGRVGLGKTNEKIIWERRDEIGSLIEEYNRMVDELARSAELLASSERESAWREMAKQVAHEIKNPLTPMKLSVQYLKKAWDEKTPEWEKRLERFTRTIIEQIDSLSQIASEFSDFAKMPVANLEKIELSGIIGDAVNLYQDIDNIHFTEDYQEKSHFVRADKRQLLRVFNNLIQNAVQAIGDREDGQIGIRVTRESGFQVVEITDNGTGISEEQAARMFTPSFTTKSSGMGLGLAMVKSIITSTGGTVSFISKIGDGATFVLRIPEYKGE